MQSADVRHCTQVPSAQYGTPLWPKPGHCASSTRSPRRARRHSRVLRRHTLASRRRVARCTGCRDTRGPPRIDYRPADRWPCSPLRRCSTDSGWASCNRPGLETGQAPSSHLSIDHPSYRLRRAPENRKRPANRPPHCDNPQRLQRVRCLAVVQRARHVDLAHPLEHAGRNHGLAVDHVDARLVGGHAAERVGAKVRVRVSSV